MKKSKVIFSDKREERRGNDKVKKREDNF